MNSSRYFKLGLFVLIGVALLVGTIVTLGAGSLFAKTVLAETYVDESVAGLEAGSAVKYRGVTVGRVKDIRFAASKYAAAAEAGQFSRKILIEMSLNADVVSEFGEAAIAKMVQEGLRARITQTGITGAAYVGLDFYDPKAYPPAAINWKPEGVYIPAIPSITSEVMTTVERLMTDFTQADLPGVLKRFDTLLEDVNKSVDELKLSEVREQVVALLTEVRVTNSRI
jgi:ABC-type transporter Mla subunit MlaD